MDAASGAVIGAPVAATGALSGRRHSCGEVSARRSSKTLVLGWSCAPQPEVLRLPGRRRPPRRATTRSRPVALCTPPAVPPPAASAGTRGSRAQPARPGRWFDPLWRVSLLARETRANPASRATDRHQFEGRPRRDQLPGLQHGTERANRRPDLPQVALTEPLTTGTAAPWRIG